MKNFEKLKKLGAIKGDTNFCGVVTLAVVADKTYEEAYTILKACGRKHGDGIYMSQLKKGLETAGHKYGVRVSIVKILDALREHKNYNVKNLTTKQLNRNIKMLERLGILEAGAKYVITTNGHVLGCDGEVVDWSSNRALRILSITQVV